MRKMDFKWILNDFCDDFALPYVMCMLACVMRMLVYHVCVAECICWRM